MSVLDPPSGALGAEPICDLRVRRPSAGVSVIDVVGELDLATAPALFDAVRTEMLRECDTVALDLSGVSFCSARGIGILSEITHDLTQLHATTVRLENASAPVLRAARLTGTEKVLAGIRESGPTPGERGRAIPSRPALQRGRRGRARMTPRDSGGSELVYGWPVLFVVHDADGIWHLLPTVPDDSRAFTSGSGRPSSWVQLTARDATLRQLDGMPRGWVATREHSGRPWRRRPG